ncbi:MAG: cell filamentation protein Fic [SAR86 cluster bacterium]|uniref:Cell filamentation protein Fic n=1 Tax=SAR86 cluster bacterium TaxID=2030880 RepID=A0A2A4X6E5_9GAMM|nr:MAG: cell filamentation protein Fic [SAR86 cluster bacterium]
MAKNVEPPEYFQYEQIPPGTQLAGWTALVRTYGIDAPVRNFSCVSDKHVRGNKRTEDNWEIFDKRYKPSDSLEGQLNFAFRHEVIDLLVMKRVFDALQLEDVANFVLSTPTGATARRVWFFYEFLTGRKLEIKDSETVTAVDAFEPDKYFAVKGKLSQRHRVRNNLLGPKEFCPVIRKTDTLSKLISLNLDAKAKETIGKIGAQVIARAASFMLLADSKASFEIEGERPPKNKLDRWGRAVLEAGKRPLNQTEIYRLHQLLIGDDRFTEIGYRSEGVFLGERDQNHDPIPEFIGARHEDVPDLMFGLNECNNLLRTSLLDPVLQAAVIAFGFVYIHPLADGNGRLHRCLIHHVLAERKFTPPGMVFPVSSVMQDEIDDYREALQKHSSPLMDYIDWHTLPNRNVEVTNDTADLYRYIDCTGSAEFLYECVRRTVEKDLPQEIKYLKCHEEAMRLITEFVELPDRLAQDLIMFIRQNDGKLPKRRREKEFEKLTDKEVSYIEEIVNIAFE